MLVPRTTPTISPFLRLPALAAAAALTMAACSGSDDAASTDTIEPTETAPAATEQTITLVAYESFPSEGTRVNERLDEFGERTGIEVEILIAGDTGTMLSKAELTAGNPEGDVMWGVDSTFLSRAIGSEICEP